MTGKTMDELNVLAKKATRARLDREAGDDTEAKLRKMLGVGDADPEVTELRKQLDAERDKTQRLCTALKELLE